MEDSQGTGCAGMIAKVPQFENPIIIQFTASEGAAVSYWLDEIDWEDIHIAVDGSPGCGDKSHYLDTNEYEWNRIERQAWKWAGDTLAVYDEVGLECLLRTRDYCAESDEPVGFVHVYHDWKNPACPDDQRAEVRQGHYAANRAAKKIDAAIAAAQTGTPLLSASRQRNAKIQELCAVAGRLDKNDRDRMTAEDFLRLIKEKH